MSDTPKLRPARSFVRMQSPPASPGLRTRASTVQIVSAQDSYLLSPDAEDGEHPDVFAKRDSTDSGPNDAAGEDGPSFTRTQSLPDRFDELPIELISFTARFVDSLSAKVHSTPPSIEKLSDLYQEFYVRAASHISTHVSALASRLNRESSPARPSEKTPSDRQMLTATEVTERRKARKLLEYKRLAWEEAVERRACESIYDKIWRHRSTIDEVRDEKLRSKTAALSVVGIGLKDLGIDIFESDAEKEQQAYEQLKSARQALLKMNDEKYPLGKLHQLVGAHKAIVETLANVLPSSSSADEILPTLIYTLITTTGEDVNVISNLLFIQRFRAASKLDGEAAYCLTNLEAAISFLENVDLSSLRADELPEGPPKQGSTASSPSVERRDPLRSGQDNASISSTSESTKSTTTDSKLSVPATLPRSAGTPTSASQRRLSNIFPPAKALEAANDAVRNTADQGLKNISNTLDNSFNFLFGRLKEMQVNQGGVPKTLDEARRLVNHLDQPHVGEDGSIRESPDPGAPSTAEEKLLGLISGRKPNRQYSAESLRSAGSGRKAGTVEASPNPAGASTASTMFSSPSTPTPPNALESMRNFGNTLNPLNRLPGMIRGFGRAATDGPVMSSPAAADTSANRPGPSGGTERDLNVGTSSAPNISTSSIDPQPIQRFLEVQNANDLKIGEVTELLQDYKRLAGLLTSLGGKS